MLVFTFSDFFLMEGMSQKGRTCLKTSFFNQCRNKRNYSKILKHFGGSGFTVDVQYFVNMSIKKYM